MRLTESHFRYLDVLNKHDLSFVVIGGHAVNFYGVDRETKDLDVYVNNDKGSSIKLTKVITELIGPHPNVNHDAFIGKKRQINFSQHGIDLEILTEIDDLDFKKVFERSSIFAFGEKEIRVISKEDLIKSKTISGRELDISDIKCIESI